MNKTGRNAHRDYDRGNAFQAQCKLAEAIDCYRRAIDNQPKFADAQTNLGTALHRLGKLNEAVASYRFALSFTPDAADLHYNLGSAFMAPGKPDKAVTCFRSALSRKHAQGRRTTGRGNRLLSRRARAEAGFCGGSRQFGLCAADTRQARTCDRLPSDRTMRGCITILAMRWTSLAASTRRCLLTAAR